MHFFYVWSMAHMSTAKDGVLTRWVLLSDSNLCACLHCVLEKNSTMKEGPLKYIWLIFLSWKISFSASFSGIFYLCTFESRDGGGEGMQKACHWVTRCLLENFAPSSKILDPLKLGVSIYAFYVSVIFP